MKFPKLPRFLKPPKFLNFSKSFFTPTLLILLAIGLGLMWLLQAKTQTHPKSESFQDSAKPAEFTYYFMPWCDHCKQFMPIWDQLSKDYNKDDQVIFKKVNMELENNKFLGSKYNITSYPTLILHKQTGESVKFTEERNAATLTAFLDSNLDVAKIDT